MNNTYKQNYSLELGLTKMKKEFVVVSSHVMKFEYLSIVNRHSFWLNLFRTTSWILRIPKLRETRAKYRKGRKELTPKEIEDEQRH